MTLTTVPNNADLATVLEHYHRDGGVIVENLIDEDTIATMRESVIRRAKDVMPGSTSDPLAVVSWCKHRSIFAAGKSKPGVLQDSRKRIIRKDGR